MLSAKYWHSLTLHPLSMSSKIHLPAPLNYSWLVNHKINLRNTQESPQLHLSAQQWICIKLVVNWYAVKRAYMKQLSSSILMVSAQEKKRKASYEADGKLGQFEYRLLQLLWGMWFLFTCLILLANGQISTKEHNMQENKVFVWGLRTTQHTLNVE